MAERRDEGTELGSKMERVEQLVESLEHCSDPLIREQVQELVATLMDFHATALARVLEIALSRHPEAQTIREELGNDPMAGSLLLLYGLHPAEVSERVEEALIEVRPSLLAHQGDVELIGIDEKNVVRLRLKGSCHGCPSSTSTFRNLIVNAIRNRAPEIESVQVEGMVG